MSVPVVNNKCIDRPFLCDGNFVLSRWGFSSEILVCDADDSCNGNECYLDC